MRVYSTTGFSMNTSHINDAASKTAVASASHSVEFEPATQAGNGAGTVAGTAEPPAAKSLFGRYARLPELAGRTFLPLGLFARLPLAMLTVGALTLVNAVSGSVAIGGFAAGAVGIGSAIGSPLLGYLADRVGQRPVLLISALTNTVAIVALIAASHLVPDFSAGSILIVLAAAFGMGLTCPQVGPLARVRWMAMTRKSSRAGDLDTALSYESTADELTFVMGPALVGLLASLIAPWVPLALAALITVTLVSAFAVHPTQYMVVPLPAARAGKGTANPNPRVRTEWGPIMLPVLGMVCMGAFFGATQTALIAFAGSFNADNTGGLLYAVMGLSSAAAALSVAYWPARFTSPRRWLASAAAMAVLSILLFLPTTVLPMLLALFMLGISVGPTMVTIFSIGGIVAPRERLGTVMTMLASGIVVGTAIGSSLAGSIAENSGYTAAFSVSFSAAVCLFGLGLVTSKVIKPTAAR